jgi:hypothetical protein
MPPQFSRPIAAVQLEQDIMILMCMWGTQWRCCGVDQAVRQSEAFPQRMGLELHVP